MALVALDNDGLLDLSPREWVVVLPLVFLALFMGVASPRFTRYIEPSVDRLVIQLQERTKVAPPTSVTAEAAAGQGDWGAAPDPPPAEEGR